MRRLNQTPLDVMLDEHSRPYFLWDSDLTLDSFRDRLRSPDPKIRGYYLAKLLRQAKPDDAFLFVSLRDIERDWDHARGFLGETAEFWSWLVAALLGTAVDE